MLELNGTARQKNYAKVVFESAIVLIGCVCLYEALKFSLALIGRADTPEESDTKVRCLIWAASFWPLSFAVWMTIFWAAHKRKVTYHDQPSDSPTPFLNALCLALSPALIAGALLKLPILVAELPILIPVLLLGGLGAVSAVAAHNTPRIKAASFCFLLSTGLTFLIGIEAAIGYVLLYSRH